MTYLGAGDLKPDEFLRLPESHQWPDDSLLMAFSAAEARFERFLFDRALPADTDQGRIFSPSGELRWRRMGENVRVVYLGDEPLPHGLEDHSQELQGLTPSIRRFFLWGERTDTEQEWIEQQVPHRFAYPIHTAVFARGRAAIEVRDWSDVSGIPRLSRYYRLIEVEGD